VMQGRDHAKVRRAIVGQDFFMTMLFFQVDDGPPVAGPKALVDPLDFPFDLGHQVAIALDRGSAGRADLNERKLAAIGRILLEEPLDSAKPLRNPLRVIDTIYTQSHDAGMDT